MRRSVSVAFCAVVGVACLVGEFRGISHAADDFFTDKTIQDGDYFFSIAFHAKSHVTVNGGYIENRLHLYNQATGDLFGGHVNALYMDNDNLANVYSGAFINTYVGVRGTSVLNLYGGRMPETWLEAIDSSVVNLFVKEYQFTEGGGVFGDGEVQGRWEDNQPFIFNLHLPDSASHLVFHNVPEPSSIALAIVGVAGVLGARLRTGFASSLRQLIRRPARPEQSTH